MALEDITKQIDTIGFTAPENASAANIEQHFATRWTAPWQIAPRRNFYVGDDIIRGQVQYIHQDTETQDVYLTITRINAEPYTMKGIRTGYRELYVPELRRIV